MILWFFNLFMLFRNTPLGAYAYHFWMKNMQPIKRRSGNQHVHKRSAEYRNAVRRKLAAYHRHIQTGVIAQGLLQYISSAFPLLVWNSFGSWLRTIRPGICPSEQVAAIAMRNCLPEKLRTTGIHYNWNTIAKYYKRYDFCLSNLG